MRYQAFWPALFSLLFLPAALLAASKESFVYVQIRESKLRAEPQFWSPAVADITYGSALVALGAAPTNKAWIRAKLGDKEGFVHVSAITSRKIVLQASAAKAPTKASQADIVLAGKGFNRQVENSFRTSKGLDFAAVDEVEQYRVESAEEAAFLRDGKLVSK